MRHTTLVPIRRATPTKRCSRSYFALAITIAVWLAALPSSARALQPAGPATTEDALKQIEALKKQLADLEKFVREQAQQRGVTAPPSTAEPAQPPTGVASD